MTTPCDRIIVFAKWPVPGAVKTRLGATIGLQRAADLARAFLLDVTATANRLPVEHILAYSPRGTREQFRALLPPGWSLRLQRGADLGERLANAMAHRPDGRTLILGTDSPWLTETDLSAAFSALNAADVVLGPCRDGGFYLIGFRSDAPPALFSGVRWSTEYALADQTAAAERLGRSVRLLPEGYDIDTEADLKRLEGDLASLPAGMLVATRVLLESRGVS